MNRHFKTILASAGFAVSSIALGATQAPAIDLASVSDPTFGGFVEPGSPETANGFGVFSYDLDDIVPSSFISFADLEIALSDGAGGLVNDVVLTLADAQPTSGVAFDATGEFEGLNLTYPFGTIPFDGSEGLIDFSIGGITAFGVDANFAPQLATVGFSDAVESSDDATIVSRALRFTFDSDDVETSTVAEGAIIPSGDGATVPEPGTAVALLLLGGAGWAFKRKNNQ